jgi:large repetitive protein
MTRLSIQWASAVAAMLVCAGVANGQTPNISPTTLPGGEVGAPYGPQVLNANDSQGSCCMWTPSGALGGGLSLTPNGSTATISGTPTSVGPITFTVTANDTGVESSVTFTIQITAPTIAGLIPAGEQGAAYSATLTATGGAGTGYQWSESGALPAGISPNPGTSTFTLSGVPGPGTAGTYPFTVTLTDANGGTSGPQNYNLLINPPPAVTTASVPQGEVTAPYSTTLTESGGTGPNFAWSLAGGSSLPAGLSLSSAGVISGTPTGSSSTFQVQVTDSANVTSAAQSLTLTVVAAPSITTAASLPQGEVGAAYSKSLSASGGSGAGYTWALATGSVLPAGLTLSSAGLISGTPTAAGPFSFTVKVTDGAGGSGTQAFSVTIIAGPTITTSATLPQGEVNASYSPPALAASGGTGTGYTWSLANGSVLPAGLALSSGGVISGTPTASGPFNFTVQVTDSAGGSGTLAFSLTIVGGPTITTGATLLQGEVGGSYPSTTLAASGGSGTGYTWSLAAGSALPAGLALSSGGVISGTPTTSGPFSFTIKVTDSAGGSGTLAFSLTIINGPTITNAPTLPNGTANVAFTSVTLTATGGTTPYTWSITLNNLPAGLTLDGNTGIISGTPTATGTFTPTVQVLDAKGVTGTKVFSITIASGLTIVTAPTLPNGSVGTPYTVTLMAQGGSGSYTWAVTAGAPPTGLTPGAAGVISGNPTASGTFSFTVQVTDSNGVTATKTFSITISSSLTITNAPTLPSGVVGGSYSQTLSATGGTPPYTWIITAGSPPGGLSLSLGGIISGTPSTGGTFSFTAQVTDSTTLTATKSFTLSIAAQLAITTQPTLPSGGVGTSYSQALTAVGGTAPYTWSVTAGALPGGLSLNPTSGVISGTPTTVGNITFTVQVRDNNSDTTSEAFTLAIVSALTITTAPTLPVGAVGVSYSQAVVVVGGTAPYTWSISSGGLPAGLALAPASGAISGSPSSAGSFTFTVHVTDSTSLTQTKAFTIAVVAGLTVTTPPVLPSDSAGVSYTVTLAAAGGQAPYTWAVTAGSLPAGLVLDAKSGAVFGTPTASGTFSFSATVTDSASNTAVKQFTINIAAGLTISSAPVLPNGAISAAYSAALNAVGGVTPYSWSVSQGTLPAGLTLDPATGLLTGSPTASGEFTFTVQVTDSSSAIATKAFDLVITTSLVISTPATLPIGSVGVPYSLTLVATGGSGSYLWKVTSGNLPTGLTLAVTGAISGTPIGSGTFIFTIAVDDTNGHAASQQFSLTIASGIAISTPAQLPSGSVGAAYSQTPHAVGGTPPYRWAVTVGALPGGLGLNPATGVISGTPLANGTFHFTLQVTDNTGATASLAFTLTIGSGLTITSSTLPSGTLGVAYATQFAQAGGVQPYSWTIIQGALPPGLLLTGAGAVSGTPSAPGVFTFTVQVTDSNGATASQVFSISINPPALPQVNISGVPESSTAAQQINFGIALASGYPLEITGTVTISFAPDAVAPAVDPAIQFSTGGTTVNFTIPSTATNAVFGSSVATQIGLQTGTIAGAITLTFTLEAGGVQLPSTGLSRTITIPRTAPSITAVAVVTSSNTFQVEVTGFSTPRELTEADLTFTAASGQSLQTTSAIIDLTAVGQQWFQSAASAQYGSQYILVLPFTASQGSVSAVASVTVTLKNSTGSSSAVSAKF